MEIWRKAKILLEYGDFGLKLIEGLEDEPVSLSLSEVKEKAKNLKKKSTYKRPIKKD